MSIRRRINSQLRNLGSFAIEKLESRIKQHWLCDLGLLTALCKWKWSLYVKLSVEYHAYVKFRHKRIKLPMKIDPKYHCPHALLLAKSASALF